MARSWHPFALALQAEAESRSARALHSASAIRAIRDKVATALALARHPPAPDDLLTLVLDSTTCRMGAFGPSGSEEWHEGVLVR